MAAPKTKNAAAAVEVVYDSNSDIDGDVETDDEAPQDVSSSEPEEKDEPADGVLGNRAVKRKQKSEKWASTMASILGNNSDILTQTTEKYEEDEELAKERRRKIEKVKWDKMGRTKPKLREREKERAFQKIATRGVVQLFNAVQKQQKSLSAKLEEVGTERKREKVMKSMTKGDFVDMLKGTTARTLKRPKTLQDSTQPISQAWEEEEEGGQEEPVWGVLRDDFMMGATVKDWDKNSDYSQSNGGSSSDVEI